MLEARLRQFVYAEVAGDVEQIAADIATAEPLPIDFIAGFLGKLLGEGAKRAAVAIAERVNIVQLGVNPGEPRREFRRLYRVDLEPTAGHEQRGHRPVLVVSSEAFNRLTQCPVILPITNGSGFARRVGFAVPISGIKTSGVVRCDQPRALDLAARNGRKVDTLPPAIMDEVLATVATLFQ